MSFTISHQIFGYPNRLYKYFILLYKVYATLMVTSTDNLPWFAAHSPLYFGVLLASRPLGAVSMSFSDLTFPHLPMLGVMQVLYTYMMG
jgi:hypothetical protein